MHLSGVKYRIISWRACGLKKKNAIDKRDSYDLDPSSLLNMEEIQWKKIVLLALCLVCSGFFLTGCSGNSEPFEEKSYTPDTEISEINLDVRDREIEVALSEDEQVHIQYSESSKEYYDISVSDDKVLSVTSASEKEWTDYIGGKPSAEDRKNNAADSGQPFRYKLPCLRQMKIFHFRH